MTSDPARQPEPGAAGQPGPDASMEDILASIRRILAEDQAAPMPTAAAGPAAPPPVDDVLDLTEQMLAPETAAESPPPVAEDIDASLAAPPAHPARAMTDAEIDAMFTSGPRADPPAMLTAHADPSAPVAPAAPVAAAEGALIGGTAAAAAAASFAALRAAARPPAEPQRAPVPDILLGQGGITLEQMVREELRPLLKAWLDANLPLLVENLVKTELERLARG